MHDRHAQFLIAVGDLCAAAALATLEVALRTRDGHTAHGVPGSIRTAESETEAVDDSGWARTFRVDNRLVNLDDIVECTIAAPGDDPAG